MQLFRPRIERLLARAHSKSDLRARKAAIDEIGRIGGTQATEALLTELDGIDYWGLGTAAAGALGTILRSTGDPQIALALAKAYTDKRDENVKQAAADALRGSGHSAVQPLIELSGHPDSPPSVTVALGLIGDPQAIEPLITVAATRNRFFDNEVNALANIGRSAVHPLVNALGSSDERVRQVAVEALGKIGDFEALAPLKNAMRRDQKRQIRESASRAIARIACRDGHVWVAFEADCKRVCQRCETEEKYHSDTRREINDLWQFYDVCRRCGHKEYDAEASRGMGMWS